MAVTQKALRQRQQRDYTNRKEMSEIFESFEYLIFEKAEALDHILACMNREAATCGVSREYALKFTQEKLTDMIDQIAEKREASERRRPRGRRR